MKGRLLALAAILLVAAIIAIGAAIVRARHPRGPRTSVAPATGDVGAAAESGPRIRVEVLNATTTRGLARRAAFYLRDQGFDVVEMGNTRGPQDSTIVIDRSNHPEWAKRVAGALGGARVDARPDSSRYLDVTVVLGRAWRAPAKAFYP